MGRRTRPGAAIVTSQDQRSPGSHPLSLCSSGDSGLWRSGSASHWQCGGQGFESPQLHRTWVGVSIEVVPRKWPFRPLVDGGPFDFSARRYRAMTSETKTERYAPAAIEPKWQAHWASTGLYNTPDDS